MIWLNECKNQTKEPNIINESGLWRSKKNIDVSPASLDLIFRLVTLNQCAKIVEISILTLLLVSYKNSLLGKN